MGGTYTRQGDYCLPNLALPSQEERHIGVWGERRRKYLKEHRRVLYYNLLTSGKLQAHLADVEEQAQEMFERLTKQMAEKQGATEALKAADMMAWVGRMNNIIYGLVGMLAFANNFGKCLLAGALTLVIMNLPTVILPAPGQAHRRLHHREVRIMRSRFDEQLDLLNKEMITMGALCENAIAMSAKAVAEGDLALTESIPALAEQIGQKEREIESLCLKLLLQQQPVAKDLRIISSALKMVTDMERIGHQSADIAEIVRMANLKVGGDTEEVRNMALAVIKMVSESIDAFVKKDDAMAQAVIAYDDVVDDCFDRVKKLLIGRFSQPGIPASMWTTVIRGRIFKDRGFKSCWKMWSWAMSAQSS